MISLGRSHRYNALILNIWMILFHKKAEILRFSCRKKMSINLLIQKVKND